MGRRRYKKPPEGQFEAKIERLSHEGRGIASVNGKTTFIAYALPDETVQFEYTATHGQYDEGQCLSVNDSASPMRAIPECPHFSVCGGCSLQHMRADAQREHKQTVLLELIQNQTGVQPTTVLEPLKSESYGYRRKARLGIRHVAKKGLPLFGFRETNGRYLAVIESCKILHPSLGEKVLKVREMLNTLSIKDQIAQCEASLSDDKKILIFRNLKEFSQEDKEVLKGFASEEGFEIYQQPGNESTTQGLDGEAPRKQYYQLPDFDLTLGFMPHDFTQVNFDINAQMVTRAIEELELSPEDTMLDLFCGLGNFSLAAARQAGEVIGVEGSTEMTVRASDNAKLNNIHNTSFYSFDLTQDFKSQAWCREYDKLLIDPPRSGALNIVEQIEHLNAKRIVYISCNPATLARDLAVLINEKGYTLDKAGIMDMFPHTGHVESMAVLSKN